VKYDGGKMYKEMLPYYDPVIHLLNYKHTMHITQLSSWPLEW